jgi:hypothetical protein
MVSAAVPTAITKGPVEAQLRGQPGDILGRAALAEDEGRRIARQDPEQEEGDQCDAEQDRDQLDEPAEDESEQHHRAGQLSRG